MSAGIDVRINPQRYRRLHAQFGGHLLQSLQLVGGLDVKAVHANLQGAAHVVAALTDAGEDHFFRFATGGQNPLQLATGDDVEAGTEARQYVQHAEIGVGFNREANHMLDAV